MLSALAISTSWRWPMLNSLHFGGGRNVDAQVVEKAASFGHGCVANRSNDKAGAPTPEEKVFSNRQFLCQCEILIDDANAERSRRLAIP